MIDRRTTTPFTLVFKIVYLLVTSLENHYHIRKGFRSYGI